MKAECAGERIVLVLNGGGALGAYQCGVYRALVRKLDVEQRRSMVIVGASSGAINGFLIAARSGDPDGGAAALERFWRSVSTPSIPFAPLPHPCWQRLNGSLTGLLLGNPSIFRALPGGFLASMFDYPRHAAYEPAALGETLSAWAEVYEGGQPRLLVRAIDMAAGEPVWFDSGQASITPSMIVASSAIPLLFRPGRHAGRLFWDGDIWPESPLEPALDRLGGERPWHVLTVELFSREAAHPLGLPSGLHQFRTLFLGGRSDRDAGLAERRPGVRLTRIRRAALPHEAASLWLFDWAPEHIDALIKQGEADAGAALRQSAASVRPAGGGAGR